MSQDIFKGYVAFLSSSIKVYFLGENVIQKEVDFFTQNSLKDGLIFFLLAFNLSRYEEVKNFIKNPESLEQYLVCSEKSAKLTVSGEALQAHLKSKLQAQADMLRFNSIKPQYLAKMSTILSRFYKFWKLVSNS